MATRIIKYVSPLDPTLLTFMISMHNWHENDAAYKGSRP